MELFILNMGRTDPAGNIVEPFRYVRIYEGGTIRTYYRNVTAASLNRLIRYADKHMLREHRIGDKTRFEVGYTSK